MKHALLVAAGGAAGSVLRWIVSGWVQHWAPRSNFPWGTLAVNVTGSFAIGVLLALALERGAISANARLLLVTGVLGGYTTFSAFSWETLQLARGGQWPAAIAYSLGSVVFGTLAAFAGMALAERV